MNAMRIKITIACILVASALAYLASAGVKKGWSYYLEVDNFLADPQYHNDRVKLCGIVAADAFSADRARLAAHFILAGKTGKLSVVYHGSIPDMFRVGAQVVVEGKLNAANIFEADSLVTKCASKYEAQTTGGASPAMPAMPSGHPKVEPPP